MNRDLLPSFPIGQDFLCQHFIGGAFVSSANPNSSHVVDDTPLRSPWTGSIIGRVAVGDSVVVDAAVSNGVEAFGAWKQTPIKERCAKLFNFREIVLTRLDELATLVALESGKTVAEGRAGILKGLEVVEFALSLQNLNTGGVMEVSRGVTCESRRDPLGVVVGIAPFNFPVMVPMWMYPIALAVGNCFILKPSEKVPISSKFIAECMHEAGFPSGVFQLVQGRQNVVEALIDHPQVKAVGFVGSTPVAKAIYRRATNLGKRALCLGGAKNLLLITPDADEAMTVRGVVDSFTGCAGQRCMAASILIAVGSVDHLIEKIHTRAREIRLGYDMGALIDKSAVDRIHAALSKAETQGATLLLDGRNVSPPAENASGCWMGPSIIDHAILGMDCTQVELFGPVLTIMRVDSLKEAMNIESQSLFGNAVSVFTTSAYAARYVADHATNSMVGVNIGVPVPREPFSFGGSKDSKFGPCDITGESAVEFWTQRKKITTKWSEQSDVNWMS